MCFAGTCLAARPQRLGSHGRTRTYNPPGNNRKLNLLSYMAMVQREGVDPPPVTRTSGLQPDALPMRRPLDVIVARLGTCTPLSNPGITLGFMTADKYGGRGRDRTDCAQGFNLPLYR